MSADSKTALAEVPLVLRPFAAALAVVVFVVAALIAIIALTIAVLLCCCWIVRSVLLGTDFIPTHEDSP